MPRLLVLLTFVAAAAAGAQAPPSSSQWTSIGPRPINAGTGNGFWSGRVRAIEVDPRNADVAYLAAATGGVWKTTDGGSNWTPLTDFQPSLVIGSLALDPSNPDIVYAGTGEGSYYFAYAGVGIYKSTDGGNSWSHLAGPFVGPLNVNQQGPAVVSLAVHPTNGQLLLAGVFGGGNVASGVYRSDDGGVSWRNVRPGFPQSAVLFDPTNGSVAYVGLGPTTGSNLDGVYKSADAGLTWVAINGTGPRVLPPNIGWRTLAIAPSAPRILYLSASDAGGSVIGFFKTVDGGATWSVLGDAPDYCSPGCRNFTNVIGVHPTDSNVVFVGGITQKLFRSLDGGITWAAVARGSNILIHGDEHALSFSKDGRRLYVGDDGGAYSTGDIRASAVNWANLNGSLAITQFHGGISIHPTNPSIGFGGTQDNGLLKYSGGAMWSNLIRGDGGATLIDPIRPSTVYAYVWGSFGNQIHKSVADGNPGTWSLVTNGIDPADRPATTVDGSVGRRLPLAMDPSNSSRLYFGTFRIYQSTDGAGSWAPISTDLAGANSSLSAIAVAPGDPNTVYAGSYSGRVHVTTNAGAGREASWMERTAGLPTRGITQIAVDPLVPTTAYVLFAGFSGFSRDTMGHVFKTTDGGVNWTDISGNLPNTPAYDIVVDPDFSNTLYVATTSAVFATVNGGTNWFPLGSGLPRAPVLALQLHEPTRTLRAGTHGRGMWDLIVAQSPTPSAAPLVK